MVLTKTIHPPAGATALLAATEPAVVALGWLYVGVVVLGTVVLLAVREVEGEGMGLCHRGDTEGAVWNRYWERLGLRRSGQVMRKCFLKSQIWNAKHGVRM